MQWSDVLDICARNEERAAALYRRFARQTEDDSPCRELWGAMAAEEDQHAASIREARRDLPYMQGWHVHLEGWSDAMRAIDESLQRGERLPPDAGTDRRLAAAFDIELGEMDALRHAALGPGHHTDPETDGDHLARLAALATRCSSDPHVLTLATIARARRRLTHPR